MKLSLAYVITGLLIFCWFKTYGFEGLAQIAERNKRFTELCLTDPTNPFYMKAGIYSVGTGWFQTILTYCGNTLSLLGIRMIFISPLILAPAFLLFQGLKRKLKENKATILMLAIFTLASPLYATVLSLLAGHTISFLPSYSIFSLPYFILLLSFSIYQIFSEKGIIRFGEKAAGILQLLIMTTSVSIIYFAYDSHTKGPNNFELQAQKIAAYHSGENKVGGLLYKDLKTAIEINKYLPDEMKDVQQRIDTNLTGGIVAMIVVGDPPREVVVE